MSSLITTRQTVESALKLASSGWAVFPLHTPSQSGCTCGKYDCSSIGKHPRTLHGVKDATTDHAVIDAWWRQWPDSNIGLATGPGSGLVVLDIDPRHGGDDALAQLEHLHGELPPTVEVLTGGGGRHVYFAYSPGLVLSNSASKLGSGLDIRSAGGYVVAPPSLHVSGQQYEWEAGHHPEDVTLASLPDWLLNRLKSAEGKPADQAENGVIHEGQRNDALTRMAGAMRRKGLCQEAIAAALVIENGKKCSPPLSQWEVEAIARSIGRYPAGDSGADSSSVEPSVSVTAYSQWPTLNPLALHGVMGELVRAIEPHTEADPVALLIQGLAAFGNCLNRGPHFRAEADQHGMNLFAVLVGETSKGRKGTSWGYIRNLFRIVDEDWAEKRILSGLSSGEGLIWAVRDEITKVEPIKEKGRPTGEYQTIIVDPGVEDKRLFVLESEFANALHVSSRDGNTLTAIIRQAWDAGDLRTMTKNSAAKASGAHISILGHITRDELLRLLSTTEAANGFCNRFLWLCVRRSKSLPEGGQIHEADLGPIQRRLMRAVQFARGTGEVCRDEEARALWIDAYPQLSEGKPGMLGAIVSRAEAQVMRLACLFALLDESALIRVEHLRASLALWDYCEASARYIFGQRLGDPVADELLSALRQHPQGMTRTEIRDWFGRNRKACELDRGLSLLKHQGLARSETQESGGRPSERWVICTTKTT